MMLRHRRLGSQRAMHLQAESVPTNSSPKNLQIWVNSVLTVQQNRHVTSQLYTLWRHIRLSLSSLMVFNTSIPGIYDGLYICNFPKQYARSPSCPLCHLSLALDTKLILQSVSLTDFGGQEWWPTKKTEPHRIAATDRQQVRWDGWVRPSSHLGVYLGDV